MSTRFRCVKEEDLPKPASSVVDKAINAGLRRVSCIEVVLSIDEIKSEGNVHFILVLNLTSRYWFPI